MLKWAATDMPKLAEMIQKAEESESLVMIGWRAIGKHSAVVGDERLGKQSMWISTKLLDKDVRLVAKTMAHELYHVDEGRQVDSIQEEMEAYAFEYEVARKLALPIEERHLDVRLHGFDPQSESGLLSGVSILEKRREGSTRGSRCTQSRLAVGNTHLSWNSWSLDGTG